ncbi:MAG: type VI secretion system tip protein VgrG [Pyrinomonadaceae bacterium]
MPVVTAIIKCDGKTLPAEYELLSIETLSEVNRIPSATLVFVDGNPAKQQFVLSDQTFFEPGKTVEIQLRYEDGKKNSATIFKGLVVKHNLEVNAQESTLSVELQDAVVGMTRGRNSAVFRQKSDADIFKSLINDAGAKAGSIAPTEPKYEEIVQYYCSNWDFMLSRAEVNNLLAVVKDGEVSLKKLEITGAPKHQLEYGITEIYSFEMEADASRQYESIETVTWDIKSQKLSQKNKAADFPLSQSNLKGKTIAGKFGGKEYLLSSAVPINPKESKNWADATMARTRMSLLRGVISVPGAAEAKLLEVMELKGMGKRFNGKTLITGIRHTVEHSGWATHLQFGLSGQSFSRQSFIQDAPAAGLLPAVQGLQIGIVDAFEEDESKEFRVQVILPGVNPVKGKVWARLASPEAGLGADGKGRGYFFRPEKGDEVAVGFFNDDPRQAVILGGLYSSKNVPPKGWEKLDAENAFKGIVSKTGISFQVDDKEKTLKLLTSEKQYILIDEKKKGIEIKDLNENTITLDDKGISIKVAGKLVIEAKGDIELTGKNITLDASANVEIKGSKVDVK